VAEGADAARGRAARQAPAAGPAGSLCDALRCTLRAVVASVSATIWISDTIRVSAAGRPAYVLWLVILLVILED
jgi:hypothetical protein